MTNTSNYALRLQKSLKAEAEKVAREEGTTLNQFINVAVAEKLSALRTEAYFAKRRARADAGAALDVLAKAGSDGPVGPGDDVAE